MSAPKPGVQLLCSAAVSETPIPRCGKKCKNPIEAREKGRPDPGALLYCCLFTLPCPRTIIHRGDLSGRFPHSFISAGFDSADRTDLFLRLLLDKEASIKN